ncbi:MAG: hypothetical protein JJU33_08835 [Phycisphaerales bacterium]|nr:hypothetical protein [Phycisphaerales bacterium]
MRRTAEVTWPERQVPAAPNEKREDRMHGKFVLASFGLVFSAATAASAGQVWINSDDITGVTVNQTVAAQKYRLSNNNWDMSLANQSSTANSADFIQANLGNNAQLSGRSYSFIVEHVAGQGFAFFMADMTGSTILSWGAGLAFLGGTNAADLNSVLPNRSFNSIELEAWVRRDNASMSFSDLQFFAPDLDVDGSFFAGVAENGDGPITQRIVSDADLSLFDWSLTGTLVGARDSSAAGDETVRFEIRQQNIDFVVIPLPTGAGLAGLGLGLVALRRRR